MKKFLFCLAAGVLMVSCKKEQPQMAALNEGCDCAKEVSADFLLQEMTEAPQFNFKTTETDSIFGNKNVRFYAKEDNAAYTWYIGSEVLNTREVMRYFPNSMVGQTIPVTLVVRKSPNHICLPNDDGYDSIVKYLTIAQPDQYDFLDTTLLEGTYRVKSVLLPDSVDITIDYVNYNNGDRKINIYNYDGQGSDCVNAISRGGASINYRQFWINEGNGTTVTQFDGLLGDVHILLNNTAEINFTTGGFVNGVYNNVLKDYKFRGRKL